MTAAPHRTSLCVTVIADNPETSDGLREYLDGSGVHTITTRALLDDHKLPSSTHAVVLFPDEFDAPQLMRRIAALRSARPELLLVVVTSLPQRLRPALDPDGRSVLPIVLAKPAFGWSILDAIRGHARPESPC